MININSWWNWFFINIIFIVLFILFVEFIKSIYHSWKQVFEKRSLCRHKVQKAALFRHYNDNKKDFSKRTFANDSSQNVVTAPGRQFFELTIKKFRKLPRKMYKKILTFVHFARLFSKILVVIQPWGRHIGVSHHINVSTDHALTFGLDAVLFLSYVSL